MDKLTQQPLESNQTTSEQVEPSSATAKIIYKR